MAVKTANAKIITTPIKKSRLSGIFYYVTLSSKTGLYQSD
ncbi:hypothetical protein SOHN41_02910 [Shewanella sp. HN-41]|nr:hypothetical protein SOHN41_02910 [Shewanella sp. HN-41]